MGNPLAIARFNARRARTAAEIKRERTKKKIAPVAPLAVRAPMPQHGARGEGVYLLRETGTNFVKIGCTAAIERRYSSLARSDNPRRLIFLGWLSRDMSDEGRFHKEFESFSVALGGGIEWFELTEEQIVALQARLVQ